MDDKLLRRNVLDELEFEPSIDAVKIGVAVNGGVVTLTGHVASYAEKLAAEAAARRVKGVTAIVEEIEIQYPYDRQIADDEIAKRVVNVLKWGAMIPENMIRVTVQKGWVTLAGEVDWQYQRGAAEDAVRRLSGITGVTTTISLKPHASATDIKKTIEDALARHAQVEANAVRISILDDGKVLLEGQVDSLHEREAVEKAAWSVAGVQSVDDRLTIAS